MYCGDETGSFVGDIGYNTSRFGYGGEDCPKVVVPSYLSHDYKSFPSSTCSASGENDIVPIFHHPTSRFMTTDPVDYLKDGVISSFDAWESCWEHAFHRLSVRDRTKHTSTPSSEVKCPHPILAIDSGNTHHPEKPTSLTSRQREIMVEIMFEKFDAPAVFIAPTPMLAAFSMGRQTALVCDMGAAGCRATPVVDGLVLKQAQRRNGMGGEWLGAVQYHTLACSKSLNPRYTIKTQKGSKTVSPSDERQLQTHFHDFALRELMYEIKTGYHVKLPLNDEGDDDKKDQQQQRKQSDEEDENMIYELPDGTKIDFMTCQHAQHLTQLPDFLFQTNPLSQIPIPPSPTTTASHHHTILPTAPIHKLIHSSISVCDADLRKELCGNILLCGSHSLFAQIDKRLSMEVGNLLSSTFKTRVLSSKNSMERKFAPWIGGSVLTSLGSFQQLWLGKTEYEEYGVMLSCNRFP